MSYEQKSVSLDDYLDVLLRALSQIDIKDVRQRRRIYDKMLSAFDAGVAEAGEEQDKEAYGPLRNILRVTIKLVEENIRAGIDIFQTGYRPEGLDEVRNKYEVAARTRALRREAAEREEARAQARKQGVPHRVPMSPDEADRVRKLKSRLAHIDAVHMLKQRSIRGIDRASVVRSLLMLQFQMIQAESRVALLWTLIGPAVLLTIISLVYFVIGTNFILNMDVPTFALLGSTTWIMCRQVIFRTSTSFLLSRALFNFQAVTPLAAAATQALLYVIIYFFVFAILLFGGHAIGIVTLTSNWFPVVLLILAMAFAAFSIGLIFGSIAVFWPYFLRFAGAIERFLQIFSAVYFVSEQLPEEYKWLVLWCPLGHGMQLIRAAYFPAYPSIDASLPYFCVWLAVLGAVGLAAQRRARSDIQPL